MEVPEEEPELRTDTERPLDRPDSDRDSRPDTERRDFDDCEDVRELLRELPLSAAPLVTPVAGDSTMPPPEGGPPAETTGARPQVSQYSSPPPTSSYDPSQPGRWQVCPG
ncbi:hypothetical protein [Streptomyces puniciscabiei]|uniref:hypothetical protein n=1 Tax=Streptomyces puniciscabiei TaxID=164348 RepID=UPI000AFEF08B